MPVNISKIWLILSKCKVRSIDSSLEDESDQISEPWNFAKLSSSALLKRLSEVFGKNILTQGISFDPKKVSWYNSPFKLKTELKVISIHQIIISDLRDNYRALIMSINYYSWFKQITQWNQINNILRTRSYEWSNCSG